MTKEKFIKLLFNPGETTCFAETPYDTHISAVPSDNALWFSINPLHTSRLDANVTAYRNILLELDNVPLREQIGLVTKVVPVSTIVFSGNKSYHFIISLKEDLPNATMYRRTVAQLMQLIPAADPSTKNPSRLSRMPGAIRPDTDLMQTLEYVGDRISIADLKLPPLAEDVEEAAKANFTPLFVANQLQKVLQVGVDTYIKNHFSGRNQFFYWLGKRCSELNYSKQKKKDLIDMYYDRMQNKKDFSKREAYAAARVKWYV